MPGGGGAVVGTGPALRKLLSTVAAPRLGCGTVVINRRLCHVWPKVENIPDVRSPSTTLSGGLGRLLRPFPAR